MAVYLNTQPAFFGTELTAAMTGSTVLIGTIPFLCTKIVFDNQGTSSVQIYVNGTAASNLWRTFPAGEALVLDVDLYSPLQGATFYGNGASGTFSISYTYKMNN